MLIREGRSLLQKSSNNLNMVISPDPLSNTPKWVLPVYMCAKVELTYPVDTRLVACIISQWSEYQRKSFIRSHTEKKKKESVALRFVLYNCRLIYLAIAFGSISVCYVLTFLKGLRRFLLWSKLGWQLVKEYVRCDWWRWPGTISFLTRMCIACQCDSNSFLQKTSKLRFMNKCFYNWIQSVLTQHQKRMWIFLDITKQLCFRSVVLFFCFLNIMHLLQNQAVQLFLS